MLINGVDAERQDGLPTPRSILKASNALTKRLNSEIVDRRIHALLQLIYSANRLIYSANRSLFVLTMSGVNGLEFLPMISAGHTAERQPSKKPAARLVWLLLGFTAVWLAVMTRKAYGYPPHNSGRRFQGVG